MRSLDWLRWLHPRGPMKVVAMAAAAAMVVGASGCFASATPMQRVSDAARELNVATRFGNVEMAVKHVDAAVQADFINRRALWGKAIRIYDAELMGIRLVDEENAIVNVEVSWSSLSDSLARVTRLTQEWKGGQAGWKLVRERRASGDTGLFGEALPELVTPHPDVHRPTRKIRPQSAAGD